MTRIDAHRSAQAENTVAMLQRAEHRGLPVLIPGGFEVRAGGPPARPIDGTDAPVTPTDPATAVYDRERLEHEREGGGAPSERERKGSRTLLARLWHRMLRPTDLPFSDSRPR